MGRGRRRGTGRSKITKSKKSQSLGIDNTTQPGPKKESRSGEKRRGPRSRAGKLEAGESGVGNPTEAGQGRRGWRETEESQRAMWRPEVEARAAGGLGQVGGGLKI